MPEWKKESVLRISCRLGVRVERVLHPWGDRADPGRAKIIPEIISGLLLVPEHGWH